MADAATQIYQSFVFSNRHKLKQLTNALFQLSLPTKMGFEIFRLSTESAMN